MLTRPISLSPQISGVQTGLWGFLLTLRRVREFVIGGSLCKQFCSFSFFGALFPQLTLENNLFPVCPVYKSCGCTWRTCQQRWKAVNVAHLCVWRLLGEIKLLWIASDVITHRSGVGVYRHSCNLLHLASPPPQPFIYLSGRLAAFRTYSRQC